MFRILPSILVDTQLMRAGMDTNLVHVQSKLLAKRLIILHRHCGVLSWECGDSNVSKQTHERFDTTTSLQCLSGEGDD